MAESHLLDNTIIIFTSDNGGLGLAELGPVPTNLEPLRKWKGHVYEGGIKVPLIVSFIFRLQSCQGGGTESQAACMGIELWVNCLNIANANYATTVEKSVWGTSYRPGQLRSINVGIAYKIN